MRQFIQKQVQRNPNLQSVLSNLVWLFFGQFMTLVMSFFVGAWVARYLGPAQFGKLSYAVVFVSTISAFLPLGLREVVIRDVVRDFSERHTILGTALGMQLIASLIAMPLTYYIAVLLNPDDPMSLVLIFVLLPRLGLLPLTNVFEFWFHSQIKAKIFSSID